MVTALPLWVGAGGSLLAHLRGAGNRAFPLWFIWCLFATLVPGLLILPGGRSGVSEHWVQRVDKQTRGLGDEAAAGFLAAVLSGFAGILLGYLLIHLSERRRQRRRRLGRAARPEREASRDRDLMLAGILVAVVGCLGLGVRFETW